MSEVVVDIHDRIGVITIDRPHARNAIAPSTIDELEVALTELEHADISVLVIRGQGDRAFVSGGDLKELSLIRDLPGAIAMATRMRHLLDRVSTFPVPVIAALNGHALGGGAEVAVAADIRIAVDSITIGFTQVRLAIMPAWGGAERLAELVGRPRAMLLIGTGQTITAQEAERAGLIEQCCARQEFDATWRSVAERFASIPSGASRSIKQVIASAKPHDHPDLERFAIDAFAQMWVSDAHWLAAANHASNGRAQ